MYHRKGRLLRASLNEALDWLSGLGITPKGRLADYEKALALLERFGDLTEEERRAKVRDGVKALLARIEIADLVRVHHSYQGREGPELRKRLRHICKGPPAGAAEKLTSAQHRNVWAELSWGAMLENVGFTTDMETAVDVLQTERVPTPITFAWEVKRPWSEDSIADLIEKGASQIEKAVAGEIDTAGHHVDGGCVVLVLDHVLAPGQALIEGIAAEQASKLIADALSEWARARPSTLNAARGTSPNVLGVMLWFRTLAQVVGPDGGTWAEAHMRHWWSYRDSSTDDWRYGMLCGFHKQIEARAQLPMATLEAPR